MRKVAGWSTSRWFVRCELLRLLENDCWRYCFKCLKLHPVEEFSTCELRTSRKWRYCIFGHWLGIVELCPCIWLTFWDKLRLVAHLENLKDDDYKFDTSESKPYLWHECSMTYRSATVYIKINPLLLDSGDILIRTQYDIKSESIERSVKGMPINCCPDNSIETSLYPLYGDTGPPSTIH